MTPEVHTDIAMRRFLCEVARSFVVLNVFEKTKNTAQPITCSNQRQKNAWTNGQKRRSWLLSLESERALVFIDQDAEASFFHTKVPKHLENLCFRYVISPFSAKEKS
eukprot:GEMP01056120.1.p1 GENE.GEMP01056120.1~~GEMP01056120.1.p1  ORF type:complete len:107 (-),score=4.29 GEMP01056120.1:1100-1420(-)